MIARNYSANGKIPVKGTLKRFNLLKRFNYKYQPGIGPLIGDRLTWVFSLIVTGASDNIEHRGRITNVKGIVAQLICLEA